MDGVTDMFAPALISLGLQQQTRSPTAYHQVDMSLRFHDEAPSNRIVRQLSPRNARFMRHLTDHGIYPSDFQYPAGQSYLVPTNWTHILGTLAIERDPHFPDEFSRKMHRSFKQEQNERVLTDELMESFLSTTGASPYEIRVDSSISSQWDNLDPLTDDMIRKPWGGWYEGALYQVLDRGTRAELSSFIMPRQRDGLILPNFIVEGVGTDQSAKESRREALYHGVVAARAMHKLRLYQADNSDIYDNMAYVIVATYHDATLKLYTVHPTPSRLTADNRELDYHMGLLRSFALDDSPAVFEKGVNAFRNAREWAAARRVELIEAANARVRNKFLQRSQLDQPE